MEVNVKDFEKPQHYLMNALNLCGLSVNYVTADLIHRAITALEEKGGDMDMRICARIQVAHGKHWEDYFKLKKAEATKEERETLRNKADEKGEAIPGGD